MPRKPSHRHPLRQVREALNKTQSEFAKLIGSSAPTVQAIENGQRDITQEMAETVMTVTGVWPFCLTEKWDEAMDLTGEPYTAVSYLRFQSGLDEDKTPRMRKEIADVLTNVLDAAGRSGKTRLALYFLSKEIATIVERLNLDEALYRVYEANNMDLSPGLSFGDLRKNPALAKKFDFNDDPRRNDDEPFCKMIPAHPAERSHLRTRWQHLELQAPWFTGQDCASGLLTEVSRKIHNAGSVRTKYSNIVGQKYREEEQRRKASE